MLDRVGWLAFVLALIPALVRLPRTRSLLRHVNDPALPERMLGSRNLIAFAFSTIATLEIILWPRRAVWSIPLQIVTFALAGWPLRRALFAETWSFASYLWFYVRLGFAIYGFWIVLVSAIWITNLDGMQGWAAAAVLGIVLLVWNEQYGLFIRYVMRTTAVTTPSLVERFRDIIAKTTVTPPHVESVDMRGGAFVNALALPDTKRSSVLFTSTLLERFDEDEIAAIFAHEVAHLEHYHPAMLQRLRWIGWALILATVAIRPLVQTVAPAYEVFVLAWPLVVLIYMIVRGGKKQKHETESDLRAVALTGNPEVMVRALIKLHEMMKLPRRLDPAAEVNASHPSLARRIQAIRAASGSSADALPEAITFRHESIAVTLHSDRLIWAEGDVTAYTLAYSALDELRIEADMKGTMRLVASDPAGRKWTMPLAQEDVVRAQAALNVVDTQLRPTPAGPAVWVAFGRIAAMVCAIAALGAMQIAAVTVAALAALSFDKPLARAAGVAGLAAGLLTLRDGRAFQFAWMLILAALLMLFIAYRDKREVVSRPTWRLVGLLGFFTLLLLVPIALARLDVLETHQAARTWPGAVVFLLAFAVANMSRATARWKTAAVAAIAIAGALVAISSTSTLDALLDDPFLRRAAAIEPLPLDGAPASEAALDFSPGDVLLSPSALAIAAVADEYERAPMIQAGRPGQPLHQFPGNAALFVDDRRLFVTDPRTGRTHLRLLDLDTNTVIWENALDILSPSLTIDRAAAAWQLLGFGGEDQIVRITGAISGGEVVRHEWGVPGTDEGSADFPVSAAGSQLLVRSTSYLRGGLDRNRLGQWALWLDPWRSETRLLMIDGSSTRELWRSPLDVNCLPGSFTGEPAICTGYDGSRTHIASLNPGNGALTPITMFDAPATAKYARDWLTGWTYGNAFALHVPTRRLIRLDRSEDEYSGYFVNGHDALGVVVADGDSATVRIYRSAMR